MFAPYNPSLCSAPKLLLPFDPAVCFDIGRHISSMNTSRGYLSHFDARPFAMITVRQTLTVDVDNEERKMAYVRCRCPWKHGSSRRDCVGYCTGVVRSWIFRLNNLLRNQCMNET